MKLLLDEMFPAVLAEELRRRGHDAIAIQERSDLVGRDDTELLAVAGTEARVLVTEDARVLEASDVAAHHGVLFTSPRSLPRASRALGRLIASLDAYLRAHPDGDHLVDRTEWLAPADQ